MCYQMLMWPNLMNDVPSLMYNVPWKQKVAIISTKMNRERERRAENQSDNSKRQGA
jgi:hypothetical protein